MARWILCALAFALALALSSESAPSQEHRHRRENKVLFGVVTQPVKGGLEVLHVLPKSPADKARIEVGDILTQIFKVKLDNPMHLDDALRDIEPGAKVDFKYKRKGKLHSGTAAVVERGKYKGDFLKPRAPSSTGFDAPEWYGYAWGNVGKQQEPPTRQNTKGKIVVIHAFQGW